MKKFSNAIYNKRKTIKKTLLALLVVFLSFIIISMAATDIIVRSIFKNMEAPEFTMRYTYSHFSKDYPRKAVDFKSGDNTLRGYYYGAENESAALIVVVNGVACNSEGHLDEIIYFVDNGWRVFSFDATGIGESEGDSTVGLAKARLDLAACLDYLSKTEKDICVYAHSAGAYAAATLLPDGDIDAAALIAGFDEPVSVMAENSKRYVPSLIVEINKPFLHLQNYFTFGGEGSISAVDSINSTDTPAMIFQSETDDRVPMDISIYGKQKSITSKNKSFYKTKGGHSSAWLTEEAAEYVDHLDNEYASLQKKHKNNIPKDAMDEFTKQIDYEKANELDTVFLDSILVFFNKALNK